jgi:hypothetical protein
MTVHGSAGQVDNPRIVLAFSLVIQLQPAPDDARKRPDLIVVLGVVVFLIQDILSDGGLGHFDIRGELTGPTHLRMREILERSENLE